jgi:hypothetical protein
MFREGGGKNDEKKNKTNKKTRINQKRNQTLIDQSR